MTILANLDLLNFTLFLKDIFGNKFKNINGRVFNFRMITNGDKLVISQS